VLLFSFKLNTDLLIKSIYHNISILISQDIFFRKLIDWKRKGKFNSEIGSMAGTQRLS